MRLSFLKEPGRVGAAAIVCGAALFSACGGIGKVPQESRGMEEPGGGWRSEALRDSLAAVAGEYPGEIGIALITGDGDTVTVGNEDKYPMMSVFKLHQAISLVRFFEKNGIGRDTIVTIQHNELNTETWSPMLKDYTGEIIKISAGDLIRYALIRSDNNASNWLFGNFEGPEATDSVIATVIPRGSFRIARTEAEMWTDHSLSYENHCSPLSAAILINRLFTDSILTPSDRDFICQALRECATGTDRISAPLAGEAGVTVAHKTGSGFKNDDGRLAAHNDVAFITLPDGTHYSLAVFVKDIAGDEDYASEAISRISEKVYNSIK